MAGGENDAAQVGFGGGHLLTERGVYIGDFGLGDAIGYCGAIERMQIEPQTGRRGQIQQVNFEQQAAQFADGALKALRRQLLLLAAATTFVSLCFATSRICCIFRQSAPRCRLFASRQNGIA